MTLRSPLTRRDFLRVSGAIASGALLADTIPGRAQATDKAYTVALGQANSYNEKRVRDRVFDMLDQLGGLDDVVARGDTVAIKTNLSGGTWYQGFLDFPATEAYVTHPAVARALGEAVLDAGAKNLTFVEAVYDRTSWHEWGYSALAKDLGATLINLNDPAPYDDFYAKTVPDAFVVEYFFMHPLLTEVDAFMSLAKLKCHRNAGITLTMKNLFGIVPQQRYRISENDAVRTLLHGVGNEYQDRVPRVIIDINRQRSIDLALIDGIKTSDVAEGPWVDGWNPLKDVVGALIAGKNALATDAVGAAVMGFDPMAKSKTQAPFRDCLNHLELAEEAGFGSRNLDDIAIVGARLDDARYPFQPYSPDPVEVGDADEDTPAP